MRFSRKLQAQKQRGGKSVGRPFPVKRNDIGHVINQAIIWSIIIFLIVFVVKKIS